MSDKSYNCAEPGCFGNVDEIHGKDGNGIFLQTGCGGMGEFSFPCDTCGRLHWEPGKVVFTRGEEKIFLREGKLVRVAVTPPEQKEGSAPP